MREGTKRQNVQWSTHLSDIPEKWGRGLNLNTPYFIGLVRTDLYCCIFITVSTLFGDGGQVCDYLVVDGEHQRFK